MQQEWLIAGFGGQGILFLGDLMTRAAMAQGLEVTYMPSYGVAMRGGTASCVVRVGDESIGSPLMDEPDVAIILNQQSFDKFQPMVRKGGILVANSSIVDAATFHRTGDVRIVWIDATEIARSVASTERATNMVILGAFLAADPTLDMTVIEGVLREHSGDGGKAALLERNLNAIRAGTEQANISA